MLFRNKFLVSGSGITRFPVTISWIPAFAGMTLSVTRHPSPVTRHPSPVTPMALNFGAHTINNGGIHMAVRRAARAGMQALQVFTAIPKFYNEKNSINSERAARFKAALQDAGIHSRNVIVHAGYVLNSATTDAEKWQRSAAALVKELERSNSAGAGGVCFHPGSAGDGDKGEAIANVTRAMLLALEKVKGPTRLYIENSAGAGRTVGKTAAEIASMLAPIPSEMRQRTGYGLDTCHLFCSGYEINKSRDALTAALDEFEETIGEKPSFFHLNDSDFPFASNRDRHALIGEGAIGVDAFRWLLADARVQDVPLILETPQVNPEIGDDDDTPDPLDVRMMDLLRELSS